jgi:purine nucleoside phosphorylase
MNEAYDIESALKALKRSGLPEASGVLLGVGIGQFDTPAGRAAASRFGAQLISVHIFTECLIAKRTGLNVVGFAETAGVDPETIGGLISAALK